MKLTDLSSTYKMLSSLEQPLRILLVEGSDDFFREDCAEKYLEFWKKTVSGGEIRRISCADLLSHREEVQGVRSLFGTKTLYIVEDIGTKKADELAALVSDASEDAFFLFSCAEAAPQELSSVATSHGAAVHLQPLKPWDRQPFVMRWIQAYVKKQGKVIEPDAANILAQGYAADRQGLIQELEKVLTFRLNEPTISSHDIAQIGIVELQPTIWQILDALLAGDKKALAKSLATTPDMHDIGILRFVQNQLEKLVVAVEEGTPPRSKSHERQLAAVRKKGIATIVSWINRLKMHEVAIRSGVEDSDESSLLPFFASMMG